MKERIEDEITRKKDKVLLVCNYISYDDFSVALYLIDYGCFLHMMAEKYNGKKLGADIIDEDEFKNIDKYIEFVDKNCESVIFGRIDYFINIKGIYSITQFD